MKKVSIIIPIYNNEKTLKRCIDSILNQTYENIEIILVNDGSKDKSQSICESYLEIDKRITLITQKNQGVAIARNQGLKKATGEYIQFVDSDDYIDEKMLSILVNEIEKESADIVISGFKEYLNIEKETKLIGEYNSKKNCIYYIDEFATYIGQLYGERLLGGPCNSLYKMNIIKSNNIEFPRNKSYGEDTIFNMIYYRYCKKIVLFKDSFYNYVHENRLSLSSKYHENKFQIINDIYEEIKNTIKPYEKFKIDELHTIDKLYFYDVFKSLQQEIAFHGIKNSYKKCYDICNNEEIKIVAKKIIRDNNLLLKLIGRCVNIKAYSLINLILFTKTKAINFIDRKRY